MNLLLINFEMDPESQVLSWQYRLASALSESFERIIVLTENSARCELPGNVEVHTVPRLFIRAPLRLLGAKWLMIIPVFFWCLKHRFSACFIHMNMEWAYRLYPCFRLFRIPVLLWYAHGTVTKRLQLAHHCVDRVITSTPEGFRLQSHKVEIIGQGIDTDLFRIQAGQGVKTDIVSVGRISRRKRIDLLVDVIEKLRKRSSDIPFRLILIGSPINRHDKDYMQEIRDKIHTAGLEGCIVFAGHVKHGNLPEYYKNAFLHLNLSQTGSMDKTVMESLASGCTVLTSNEAFFDLLADKNEMLIRSQDAEVIADRIVELFKSQAVLDRESLRQLVVGKHDFRSYVANIVKTITRLSDRAFKM